MVEKAPTPFEDHFSQRAAVYARFRPTYPDALFEWLAGVAPSRRLAIDCGTGNGQAAVALAAHFDNVVATDASQPQLEEATLHPKVTYKVARAEALPAPDESADLVTVAQALHWFDLSLFFEEVKRVLCHRGILAIWCYQLCQVTPVVDAIVQEFYERTVGPYWSGKRRLVDEGYASINLPFQEIPTPRNLSIDAQWTFADMLGYLTSWSAVSAYHRETGRDAVAELRPELERAWVIHMYGNQLGGLWLSAPAVGHKGCFTPPFLMKPPRNIG